MTDQPPFDEQPATDMAEVVPERPSFDRVAARARYRKMMRGPFMRGVGIFTIVVILLAWAWGAAAAFAPNIEHLPNHDFGVRPQQCVACHTPAPGTTWAKDQPHPPLMPHWSAPSCGFCHRQSFPGA